MNLLSIANKISGAKNYSYIGVIIDNPFKLATKARKTLIDKCPENSSWITNNKNLNHHMTVLLNRGTEVNEKDDRFDEYEGFLNQHFELTITHFGWDNEIGIAAWGVSNAPFEVSSGIPHITAATRDKTVSPKDAVLINHWVPIMPFIVTGQYRKGV